MLKESVTIQDVCDLLNEVIAKDPDCAKSLLEFHTKCNEDIASHPSIQVRQYPGDKYPTVGIMGILNGLFGIREDGMGSLCYYTDNEKIISVGLTPEQ